MDKIAASLPLRTSIEMGQNYGVIPRTEEEAKTTLEQFRTNADRIIHFYHVLKKKNLLPASCEVKFTKNVLLANKIRKRGEIEAKTNYLDALKTFNEALCLAPPESAVMGRCYANRSIIYRRKNFYAYALENIEKAMENKIPNNEKTVLQNRKENICSLRLVTQDNNEVYGSTRELELSHPKHPKIPFVIDSLECVHNEEIGRHIITNRDLKPGEILVLEDPFITTLFRKYEYTGCYNCTENNFFNLMPCPDSTRAMFCSQKCIDEAKANYYQYECPIIDGLLDWVEDNFAVRALFKTLTVFKDRNELKKLIEQPSMNPFDYDFATIDDITKLQILNSMMTNDDKRSKLQTLVLICSCAVVLHMVKEYTSLKEELLHDQDFESTFLELLMRYHQIELVNNFNIVEPFKKLTGPVAYAKGNTMAQGNYLISFLFGHSCAPNAAMVKLNTRGKFGAVALHPIKAGQQVCITYGPLFLKREREDRQTKLRSQYQFDCRCIACEDVEKFATNTDLQLRLPTQLKKDMSKLNDVECHYDLSTHVCANQVVEQIVEYISGVYDEHYPCLDIHITEEYLLDVLKIIAFKAPIDFLFRHPGPEKSPKGCCFQ